MLKKNLLITVALVSSSTPFGATSSFAFGLPFSSSSKSSLQAPGYEKLTDGAGPAADGIHGQLGDGDSTTQPNAGNNDLRPLTLQSANPNGEPQSDATGPDAGVLKSTVSATEYVPKDDNGHVLESKSIKGEPNGKKLVKDASKVGLGPLQLAVTDEEANKKADTILTAEQMELNDLWEATLTRSPDIQFIVQKLQPTSNPAHLSNILMRALSTAAFGGLGAMAMMSPNMGTYAASGMAGNMIQQALGVKESKNAKAAKLSQEEQLMMFNMVRNTCDKLVNSYRDYKKNSIALFRASTDLQDLQGMVTEARAGQDSAKQLEMEYTVRKQQRDVDAIGDDVRKHRQSLVDLAGPEAIAKLDKQISEEQINVNNVPAKGEAAVANVPATAGGDAPVAKAAQATGDASAGNLLPQQGDVPVADGTPAANDAPAPTATITPQVDNAPTKPAPEGDANSPKTQTASNLSPQS